MPRNIIFERIGSDIYVRGDITRPMTPEDILWAADELHKLLLGTAMEGIYARARSKPPADPQGE